MMDKMRRTSSVSPRLKASTNFIRTPSFLSRTPSSGNVRTPKLPREREKRLSPLHEAAYLGDLELLKYLVKRKTSTYGLLTNKEEHTTPLHEAAFANRVECVKFLLEVNGNCDEVDVDGCTAVHDAAFNGSIQSLEVLLDHGAKLDAVDKNGATPLHKAAFGGHLQCMNLLINRAANKMELINKEDNYGSTAVHYAALLGTLEHFRCLKYLIEAKANLSIKDKDGLTPLFYAIYSGSFNSVQILLKSGVSAKTLDKFGFGPLHYVCEAGNAELIPLLLENGADINYRDSLFQSTALSSACFKGYYECAMTLCKSGAEINSEDGFSSPLHYAAFGGHERCINLLLEHGAKVNIIDGEGATPLHKAACQGNEDCLSLLLRHGADVNIGDQTGATPLHCASFYGHSRSLQILIEHGAQLNAVDNLGGTALHNAAFNGHIECLKILTEKGAQVDLKTKSGDTPLHYAVRNGNDSCANCLLKRNASPNVANEKNAVPLHYAIRHPQCVARLLKSGAQLNLQDSSGRTPLFYAVKQNLEETTRILIFNGADLNIEDKKGQSPLTISQVLTKDILLKITEEKIQNDQANSNKEYKIAVKKFNSDPKKGIEHLIQSDVVKGTPQNIATFLHTAQGLNKNSIGIYLGENTPFVKEVLQAYINRVDFSGTEFDRALRYFLSKFRLPGEAQKIDRIMEAFASKYCKDNPSVFSLPDTAYVLAFSIIMLNTDAHNPSIKRKMTREQFIKNNSGINGGEDLSSSYLSQIYDRIIADEIKMERDALTYTDAQKQGYLYKLSSNTIHTWKKRWFVLDSNLLYYFRSSEDAKKSPSGVIPLENLSVRKIEGKKKFSFEIYPPDDGVELKACKMINGQILRSDHTSYILASLSEKDMEDWIKCIERNIFTNPFAELIHKKLAIQTQNKKVGPIHQTETFRKSNKSLSNFKVNFKNLYDLATICSMVYSDSSESIMSQFGSNTFVGSLGKKYPFFTTVSNDKKHQYVVLGSRIWLNPKVLKRDFRFWTRDNENTPGKKEEPFLYYKIESAADQIFSQIQSHLNIEFATTVLGHSILSAVCPKLASLLVKEGFEVEKIVTFGQPRMDDKTISLELSDSSSFLRCIDIQDPAYCLYPHYNGDGIEIILLQEKYYTHTADLIDSIEDSERKQQQVLFDCHSIQHYIEILQPKVKESILVSFEDRYKYCKSKVDLVELK